MYSTDSGFEVSDVAAACSAVDQRSSGALGRLLVASVDTARMDSRLNHNQNVTLYGSGLWNDKFKHLCSGY